MACFFFNDTATTEIYTLSLHDALPISKEPVDAGELPDSTPKGTLRVSVTGGENEVNSSVEGVWLRIEDVQGRHEDMGWISRAEEHTSELQSRQYHVWPFLPEKKTETPW